MKKIGINLFIFALMTFMLTSCVTMKKYQTLDDRYKKCQSDSLRLEDSGKQLQSELKNRISQIEALEKSIAAFLGDTANLGYANRELRSQLAKQNSDYLKLLELNSTNSKAAKAEMEKLYNELKNYKEKLKQQDEAVAQLRRNLEAALLGFQDKGLSVQVRDGKVYVTLQESLLFKSGKWDVNAEGQKAIAEIAKVLASNSDISVLVEGHTDNITLKGANQVKDNWDLSVMRATSIVKHIADNPGVHPDRLTAAGRADFDPVADNGTAEGRAQNRRTDIILSPKLDILYDLIKTN